MPDSLFITFEGGEATGKSTQVRQLSNQLRETGRNVVTVAEPGGTELGTRLRRLVKYGDMPIGPRAEALLFVAARAQLVEEVIAPARGPIRPRARRRRAPQHERGGDRRPEARPHCAA